MIFAVTIGSYVIKELSNSVNELTEKSRLLQTQNESYTKEIDQKVKSIKELGEQLEDIEEIIGIDKDDTASLIQRATLAKLNSCTKNLYATNYP